MLFVVPNSGGLPEPEQALLTSLTEKWSEEARVASAAVRRARAKYQTTDDKKKRNRQKEPTRRPEIDDTTVKQVGDKVKTRTQAGRDAQKTADETRAKHYDDKKRGEAADAKAKAAADKKKSGGGGKGDDSPKAQAETKNAKGEREITYSDGSKVTVHKDGKTATHTKADGSSTTGKYRDPAPAGPKGPKGFTADTPESKARATETARKKAETERRKTERERARAKNVKQKVLRVKLSRTRKGPRST